MHTAPSYNLMPCRDFILYFEDRYQTTLIKMCFSAHWKPLLDLPMALHHCLTSPYQTRTSCHETHTHILIPGLTWTHTYHIPEWTVIAASQPGACRAITAHYHPHSRSRPVYLNDLPMHLHTSALHYRPPAEQRSGAGASTVCHAKAVHQSHSRYWSSSWSWVKRKEDTCHKEERGRLKVVMRNKNQCFNASK